MRRDSETDLPDGTVAKGTVVNKTIIVDREGAKAFSRLFVLKRRAISCSHSFATWKVAECDEGGGGSVRCETGYQG